MIRVRVVPRSSRDELCGFENGILKIKVTDPPVEGAANDKVIKLLAGGLGLSKTDIRIVKGHSSRMKTVEVRGLKREEIESALEGQ
jgi:uncharacterized protein (TIGR00251 family)